MKTPTRPIAVSAVALAGLLAITSVWAQTATQAQDQTRTQTQTQTQLQIRDDQIYGHQMMTVQERNEYRRQMQEAGSDAARERLRLEHHERMKVRAKERGITLPDDPPAGRGPGSGQGSGPGPGAGKHSSGGAGMGPGPAPRPGGGGGPGR